MGPGCLLGVVCWEPRSLRLHVQVVRKDTSSDMPGSSCGKQPLLTAVVVPADRAHKTVGKASHILLIIQEWALFSAIKVQLLHKLARNVISFKSWVVPEAASPGVPETYEELFLPELGHRVFKQFSDMVPMKMPFILPFPACPGVHCGHILQLGVCSSPQFCWLPLGDAQFEPSLLHVLTMRMFNRGGLWQAVNTAKLSTLETKIELNQNSRFDPNLTAGAFPCNSLGEKKPTT